MRFSLAIVAAFAAFASVVSAKELFWVAATSESSADLSWEGWHGKLVGQEGLDLRAGWGDSLLLVVSKNEYARAERHGLKLTTLKEYAVNDERRLRYLSYGDNKASGFAPEAPADAKLLFSGGAGAWVFLESGDSAQLTAQGYDLRPVSTFTAVPIDEEKVRQSLPEPRFRKSVDRVLNRISTERIVKTLDDLSNGFFTRSSVSQEAREAQKYLEKRYSAIPHLKVSTYDYEPTYSGNVYAFLPGMRNSTRLIILGAHYDSRAANSTDPKLRAPGADDNASGSAAVLELATVIANSVRPPFRGFEYSILFIAYSGEEQGLYGSKATVEKLRATNEFDVIASFNTDMLGYRPPGRSAILGMKDKSISTSLLEWSMNVTNLYVPTLPVLPSNSCCSDYLPYYEAGYPSIGFFENDLTASANPNYHKTTDTIETIYPEQIALDARAVGAAVMLAARPYGIFNRN